MRANFLLIAPLVCMVSSAQAQPASADPAPDAKSHFERGLSHYADKQYPAAIGEFQIAYAMDPRPEFLFAWAQAERLSGNCLGAVERYRKFLGTHPPPEPASVAKTHLANCEEILATHPQPPAPAVPAETVPGPAPAAPLLKAPVQERTRSPWYTDTIGDVLVGAGVVGIGVGVWLFASSGSDADAARSAPSYDAVRSQFEDAQSKRTLSLVMVGAGSALVAAGVIRYVLRTDKPVEPSVGLWPGGISVAGRF